jgi:energy-coupling factor transporter ATP-binding protein EcfA2
MIYLMSVEEWYPVTTKTNISLSSSLIKANAALVRYSRFNQLHEDIRLCQEMSCVAGEPQCMALEGLTGAGKSTLVKNYAEAFARYETVSGTKIPVFYMETPAPVTVKGMAARILEELGDPAAHKGPLWSMNSRLIQYIGRCDVRLVILDDFHHLIDKETNRVMETVSDWLKVLIKETNVPFLVVGIEGRVEQILRANSQLSRLFAVRERLEPFQWNPADETTIKEFASFIKYVEKGVGIPLSDELPHAELLYRLHYATDGIVGNVMNLMRFAALLAQEQSIDTLTLLTLSQSFAKRLHKHLAQKTNPFALTADQHFVAPPAPPANDLGSTNPRSKRRRKKEPTTAQVLKTG